MNDGFLQYGHFCSQKRATEKFEETLRENLGSMYEQAALLREMESESEEDRDSNESGSIESVPTYGV